MVNLANGWAFFGVRISLVPLFVTEEMGSRPLWIGIGFLCASVAQAGFLLSGGKFVDRRGRRPAMISGSLLAAAAFAAIAINESRLTFLLAMTATGVGAAFVGTAPGAVVGDIMHGRVAGSSPCSRCPPTPARSWALWQRGCSPTRCRSVRPSPCAR